MANSALLELLLFQNPQQFRLECCRDVSYLFKKQCAFIGHLEPADLLCDGSGKGAFLATKQFANQQI